MRAAGQQRSARPVLARLWSCGSARVLALSMVEELQGPSRRRRVERRRPRRRGRGAARAGLFRAHRERRDLGLFARRERPLLLHAQGSRRQRDAALRHVPPRRRAARVRARRRPAGRAARAPVAVRAARRAAVHHRGDAGRRGAAPCTSASCACARGSPPRACSTPPRNGRRRATRARSGSSRRSPALRCTTSRRRWRAARRTCASSSIRAWSRAATPPQHSAQRSPRPVRATRSTC